MHEEGGSLPPRRPRHELLYAARGAGAFTSAKLNNIDAQTTILKCFRIVRCFVPPRSPPPASMRMITTVLSALIYGVTDAAPTAQRVRGARTAVCFISLLWGLWPKVTDSSVLYMP